MSTSCVPLLTPSPCLAPCYALSARSFAWPRSAAVWGGAGWTGEARRLRGMEGRHARSRGVSQRGAYHGWEPAQQPQYSRLAGRAGRRGEMATMAAAPSVGAVRRPCRVTAQQKSMPVSHSARRPSPAPATLSQKMRSAFGGALGAAAAATTLTLSMQVRHPYALSLYISPPPRQPPPP